MENKDSISWKFYALLGTASLGILGGLYYLYNLFSHNYENDLSEEQKNRLEKLYVQYQNLNENSESISNKDKLPSERQFTFDLFLQINELTEEMFIKENPNWITERRRILDKNQGNIGNSEYASYCENMLSEKMRFESLAAQIIMEKLGINQQDLQLMMDKIPQEDFTKLQEEIMKKQHIDSAIRDLNKISNETIIKAFKGFLIKKNELDQETKMLAQFLNDNSEESKMNFYKKLESHKFMIDDYLFNGFGFDFNMLLNLLNQRKLTLHSEIERDYNNLISELSQTFQ